MMIKCIVGKKLMNGNEINDKVMNFITVIALN